MRHSHAEVRDAETPNQSITSAQGSGAELDAVNAGVVYLQSRPNILSGLQSSICSLISLLETCDNSTLTATYSQAVCVGTFFLDRRDGNRNYNIILAAAVGSRDSTCSFLFLISLRRLAFAIDHPPQTTNRAQKRIKRNATSRGCRHRLCEREESAQRSRTNGTGERGFAISTEKIYCQKEDEHNRAARESQARKLTEAKVEKAAQVGGTSNLGR